MSVVDRVIAALNAHDVEAFVACYAADAPIEDGDGTVLARGHDAMRERYGGIFEEFPAARWRALHRIETGRYVVQHEEVTGRGEATRHVCVYLVEDDLVVREQVFR